MSSRSIIHEIGKPQIRGTSHKMGLRKDVSPSCGVRIVWRYGWDPDIRSVRTPARFGSGASPSDEEGSCEDRDDDDSPYSDVDPGRVGLGDDYHIPCELGDAHSGAVHVL